jgi:hypothetical protein
VLLPSRVVIALGGNAMTGPDGSATPAAQRAAIAVAAGHVAEVVATGVEVVLTHGNGPQVGNLLVKNELAAHVVPPVPLDWNVAQTQATIGFTLADELDAALAARGLPHFFPLDTYDAAPANAVLAEAPIAAQLAVLKSRAEALGGPVALLCGAAAASGEDGCVEQAPAGATAVVFARPARSEDLASIPAGATAFAPLDHAAVLLSRSGTLAFPLVLSDPRGRGMPGPVFEELRRLAPGLLARRPEVARRIHAAGALTAAALQRAGLRPTPSRVRAAAAGIAPGEAGALLAPLHDGVREDAAYGVQLLRVEPGAAAVRTDAAWARP